MKDLRTYGAYAVVTGASSGIGEQFARQLAAAGVNPVLVARRKDRLEALAAELSGAYGVDSKVVALDLLDDGAVDELSRQVSGLDVGIVVANAGIFHAGPFVGNELSDELDVLALDGALPMRLAHRFGREFVGRRRGALILVASSLAATPVPFQANYAAVKAYVLSLGQALNHEWKKHDVDVLVVSPGPTRTEGLDNAVGIDFGKLGGRKMDPAVVARTALRQLGRKAHVIPGLMNNLADVAGKYLLPRSASVRLYGRIIEQALTGPGTAA
ncbi:SDR family oxidoreductase [Amycolatopsis sp. ATCC 39116]|uniref:SDR family NAD(P)-dependent oxidoreductase n=1 Tax=Amycolatopsis sp. (strain ATCC 39116 / 75iv2) TaxID=385957 RepID=UPI0002628C85|nr:SDR family NAD(P)-dependent oxidoreductase [Amycolatopsis sp. ATCC 39116]